MVLAGFFRLQLDVQVLNLLPADLPSVRGLKIYEQHFANANELVISLQGTEPVALERAARKLAEEFRQHTNIVAQTVWTPPWLEHPEETAELIAYLWLNQDPEVVRDLATRLSPGNLDDVLEETKLRLGTSLSPDEIGRLSYDPLGLLEIPGANGSGVPGFGEGDELFATPDRTFRIVFVQARDSIFSYRESQRWLGQINMLIDQWRSRETAFAPIVVKFTGRPAFVGEIAGNMERDMTASVAGTGLVISILFWSVHRRLKPLLWLLALLLLILVTVLALGGLIFQNLNVISIGFAAILLGLSADYALVLYQEFINGRGRSKETIRRAVAPSIIWASTTTCAAFMVLNLGGLPGLGQLGTLVGVGVVTAAGVMLALFLAPFEEVTSGSTMRVLRFEGRWRLASLYVTFLILATGSIVLLISPPTVDPSSEALRPGSSAAFEAVEEIKERMNRPQEPLWLISDGKNFDETAAKFEVAERILTPAQAAGLIDRATLPGALTPRPARQRQNKRLLAEIAARAGEFATAAEAAGFSEESLTLAKNVFAAWRQAAQTDLFVPSRQTGRWIVERLIAQAPDTHLALGLIHPFSAAGNARLDAELQERLRSAGLIVAGWELLGEEVYSVIKSRAGVLAILITVLVLICLRLAFQRSVPVLLSMATLGCAGFLLLLVMKTFGWSWNLMNLMAIPLLAGAGLDYSIHIQLGLARHAGNVAEVRHSVGRALFLCAATTLTGFGSLAWAGNAGLASLGQVCAAGIACAYIVSVWLLPEWWKLCQRNSQ